MAQALDRVKNERRSPAQASRSLLSNSGCDVASRLQLLPLCLSHSEGLV